MKCVVIGVVVVVVVVIVVVVVVVVVLVMWNTCCTMSDSRLVFLLSRLGAALNMAWRSRRGTESPWGCFLWVLGFESLWPRILMLLLWPRGRKRNYKVTAATSSQTPSTKRIGAVVWDFSQIRTVRPTADAIPGISRFVQFEGLR